MLCHINGKNVAMFFSSMRSSFLLSLILSTLLPGIALAGEYPDSVVIHQFQAKKAISKPGELVEFDVAYTSGSGHEAKEVGGLRAEIWVEREMDPPFMAAKKDLVAHPHVSQKTTLTWKADKDVFGHRATIRFVDAEDRVLAEEQTLFDVADNWIHVMRLASIGANHCAYRGYADEAMNKMISKIRAAYCNAFEVFTFSPEPYQLAPKKEFWPYQYRKGKPDVPPISKERLQAWGKRLHEQGMRFVAYNETSAIHGPEDWQIFLRVVSKEKPYAHYFEDEGMFTPNALKIAPLFAQQLEESVRMFGWDGILMDSAIACFINTAQGTDRPGRRLTTLSVGEVGHTYLAEARKRALSVNPDFRFLCQNATSVSHIGVKESVDGVYPWIAKNAERLKIQKLSEVVDLYTAEIDAHNEPRDGRYPLTYEQMSVSLNSLVEVLNRPLMAWSFLVPPFPEFYSVAYTRPLMATHLASRTQVHDHFVFYGGAISDGSNAPASRQFLQYNRFLARFSYYLHDPSLKWMLDADKKFEIGSSHPLFWKRTVYRRPLPDGGERIVINLLNLPSNGQILEQAEIPEIAQNVTIRMGESIHPKRVVCLNADDPSLDPLSLAPVGDGEGGGREYRLPPITSWMVVVIETDDSQMKGE